VVKSGEAAEETHHRRTELEKLKTMTKGQIREIKAPSYLRAVFALPSSSLKHWRNLLVFKITQHIYHKC